MATEFYITSDRNKYLFEDRVTKSSAKTYSFDFSPWAEDNNTVTTVTWSLESGNGTISGEALSSNVATALITFSDTGTSLIKILANTGTEKIAVYLDVKAVEPNIANDDYGLCL